MPQAWNCAIGCAHAFGWGRGDIDFHRGLMAVDLGVKCEGLLGDDWLLVHDL
jgi:hypothetical protein